MQETQSTPGPYAVREEKPATRHQHSVPKYQVIAPDGDDDPWLVADIVHGAGEGDVRAIDKANAHLLAASWEMRDVLKDAPEPGLAVFGEVYNQWLERVRAVLQKATPA